MAERGRIGLAFLNNKKPLLSSLKKELFVCLAEAEGLEPPCAYQAQTVFKTASL